MSDPIDLMAEQVREEWERAAATARSLAKGERLGEMRGRRQKTFDARGLHPYSVEVGRVFALHDLLPDITDDFDPVVVRQDAHREAEIQFIMEVREDA